MNYLPQSIGKAIEEFSKLPGIGPKSAERLTFHLLRKRDADVEQFGDTVRKLKIGIRYCDRCANLCTEAICGICADARRDQTTLCVVESMLDLVALEKTNEFRGLYHVLHGVISPVDGVGPDDLKIAELVARLQVSGTQEVILALNPSIEGEATAQYIIRHIKPLNLKITRIARGIPVGGNLEYADSQTIKRAMEGRMEY